MTEPEPEKEKCGAKARSTDKPCGNPAGFKTAHVGQGRCHLHGGAAPHVQSAALVRIAAEDAKVTGTPMALSAHDAILWAIELKGGFVREASDRVETLNDWMDGDRLHPVVEARERLLDELFKYSAFAIKLGLEERLVRTAERYADDIIAFGRYVAQGLGFDPDGDEARRVIHEALRSVSSDRGAV